MAARDGAAAAPPRRARRNLTYREKLTIIQKKEEETTWTQSNLALWAKETFRLPKKPTQATISNLLRNKDKLLRADVPPQFRSARRVKYPELDQKILQWVREQQQIHGPLTRQFIQGKAIELAREMQLPSDVTFSKGWVSSFIKRHQVEVSRDSGATRRVTMAPMTRTDQIQVQIQEVQVQEESKEEKEEEEEEESVETDAVDNFVEVEEQHQVEEQEEIEEENIETEVVAVDNCVEVEELQQEGAMTSIVTEAPSPSRQSVKRRRVDVGEDRNNSGGRWLSREEEGRVTGELLLDWIAVPGSYSRWWLMKSDVEKEPLCDEINLFLRSHGLRGMDNVDIRLQLTNFVTTFQAAHTWLKQTRVEYPMKVERMVLEQEGIKSHVLQMCPHYERLVVVLAPYVNYDDSSARTEQNTEVPATSIIRPTATANDGTAPADQANNTSAVVDTPSRLINPSVIVDTPPRSKSRRESTELATDDNTVDETKAQKRRLFELECERLQSEIETRNVQFMLEKTLARKKLLDAGISPQEVDRIFPP